VLFIYYIAHKLPTKKKKKQKKKKKEPIFNNFFNFFFLGGGVSCHNPLLQQTNAEPRHSTFAHKVSPRDAETIRILSKILSP